MIWFQLLSTMRYQDNYEPSKAFWAWEAQRRIELIDTLLDTELMTEARRNWGGDVNIEAFANYIVLLQNRAYDVPDDMSPPKVMLISMRGDANGVYIPEDKTLYINSKMHWRRIPFERFIEVILHENMHHIMTNYGGYIDHSHPLKKDFDMLAKFAVNHDGATYHQDNIQDNIQEVIAWRAQRAARYAGILNAGLPAWDMTTRMQEIRGLQREAGFE